MDAGPTPSRPRIATPVAMVLTLVVASLGGSAFYVVGAPAAFLTGAAVAVILAVALRMPTALPDPVRTTTFAILGVMMGASISPDALSQLERVPLALVGLLLVVVGATAASYQVLRRVGGWDGVTALCGSIPGNLSLVMAVALDQKARMEQVVMAQATRLFILVALVPFTMGGQGAAVLRTVGPAAYGPVDVLVTLVVAFAAAFGARLLRVPAPTLIGPMLVSVAISLSGLATLAVPGWLGAAAFVILGASIAVRFHGVRRAGLRKMLVASLLSFVAAFVVAFAIAALFAWILDVPLGAMFLAFAPGGLDAMIALSFLLHYEVAFVAVMHTARMIVLSIGVPVLLGYWGRRVRPPAKTAP